MKNKKIFSYLVLINLICANCANNSQKVSENEAIELSSTELYEQANADLTEKNFKAASKKYAKLYEEYPFSDLANKATLMDAYAKFENGKYKDCIDVVNNFIKTYPADDSIDYAYYLKGAASYYAINSIRLDQSETEAARVSLEELVNKYPNSKYAADAKKKIILVYDYLAAKEMDIARFYQNKRDIIGAIKHFSVVVTNFEKTSHIEEALYRLVECYSALGLSEEAKKYASVLGSNYPKSKWYNYSYNLLNHKKK